MKLRLIYYTSSGTELVSLSAAARRLKREGIPLEVVARSRLDIFDRRQEARLVRLGREAEAVIICPHGGEDSVPGCRDLLAEAGKALIHVQPTGGSDDDLALAQSYCDLNSPEFKRRYLYLRYGDEENLYRLLRFIFWELTGEGPEPPPPSPPAFEGIYHPLYSGPMEIEAYLSWARERLGEARPIVGLWFFQGYRLSGDLAPVDRFIELLEARGAIALAVFHRRFMEEGLPALSPGAVAEKFFCLDGQVVIDCLINLQPFSMTLLWPETKTIYPHLDVPVIQAVVSFSSRAQWEEGLQGLSPMDLSISVAQPELDGCLISTIVATREVIGKDEITGATLARLVPIEERVKKVVSQALSWANLRRTPPERRRLAIVFHHYPPRADRLGCAFGLDSFESVARLLVELKEAGYHLERLYEDGNALARELLASLISDRRYLSPQEMASRAVGSISADKALVWHEQRPSKVKEKMEASWGRPPAGPFVHEGRTLFGGVINGNIFITLQPPRGHLEKLENLSPEQLNLHDPELPPTHHYLFFYRWLRDDFGAQAVIHVGKHGSLEWLPGKAVALSEECYPDLAITNLPNIYPYIVNDPGEGTQTKRRSYCAIIDHMIPPQMAAGHYGELEEIAEKIDQWRLLQGEDPAKAQLVFEKIKALATKAKLDEDLNLKLKDTPEDYVESLHHYLEEIAETHVNDGLHVLGKPPEGKRLYSTLSAMVKISLERPSPHEVLKELFPELKASERVARVERMIEEALVKGSFPPDPRLREALSFICQDLWPRIQGIREEIDFLVAALSGRFVPPGPSGAPTRGTYEVLPTGRNFYSVDPLKIPSPEAWETGVRQARALMARHLKDHGRYPRTLAMVIWGSPTMRTRGDDLAEALYLLGTRPVWHQSGRVLGVEVIPTEELEFPRVDVTIRTSGFFRDAFPNLLNLLDQAICLVARLKEPPEKNFLAAHVKEDLERLVLEGLSPEEAFRRASFRVFSDRPGTYGAGVGEILDSGRWERPEDLGDVYIRWGGYAYGENTYGAAATEDFRRTLSRVEVTVKNVDTREMDIFSSDDFNAYHGGLNTAVLSARGEAPISYTGDSADPRAPKIRTTAEEARFIFRTRVLNPRWIEGMKRHGYKGAGDLSRLVDICFQWDATSKVLDDWMYESLARTYALDTEMQRFFEKHNPHALLNIAERLLEAARRGLWKEPEEKTIDDLTDLFLKMEAQVE